MLKLAQLPAQMATLNWATKQQNQIKLNANYLDHCLGSCCVFVCVFNLNSMACIVAIERASERALAKAGQSGQSGQAHKRAQLGPKRRLRPEVGRPTSGRPMTAQDRRAAHLSICRRAKRALPAAESIGALGWGPGSRAELRKSRQACPFAYCAERRGRFVGARRVSGSSVERRGFASCESPVASRVRPALARPSGSSEALGSRPQA